MRIAGTQKHVGPDKHTGYTYKGKEIVLCKKNGHPMTGIQTRVGYYPEEVRVKAATLYAVTGNASAVGELTDVPAATVRAWTREEWFKVLLDEIRAENDQLIDVKTTEIVHSALDQIGDRIKNGDHVVLRNGEVIRKPVGAKDLSLVTAINIDKRQLLRGKPTSRSEQVNTKTTDEKLAELARSFKQIANKVPPKELEITDVEFTVVEDK